MEQRDPAQPAPAAAALVKALASPAFYPDKPAEVVVHETHISWVFLAGERAYKLKKPLVLPFLDYGTPQRRLEMCREEVRLNARTAADVYVGVRAVVQRSARKFELGDAEDPCASDYVVEMRRYDPARTMAAKLERGELDRSDIDATARAIARFHAQAPAVQLARRPARAVLERVDENLRELLEVVEQRAEAERVLALERFAHAFLLRYAELIDERAEQGWVRDVHGDLRAEHVLLDGEPRLLDCVEFDPRLRAIDVAEDLAFLVMDLTALGGARYADALLDGCARHGEQPAPRELVAFYACNRALVRAKVELVRAAQSPASSAGHGHHEAAARERVAVAERFAWRARLPLVIVICGLPAAGKSRLAEALARASGLPLESSDATRKRLAGIAANTRAPQAAYSDDFDRRTYAELARLAREHVRGNARGALIDATFRRGADRDCFARAFARAAPLVFVECQAPDAVRRERARERELDAEALSDATLGLVSGPLFAWEPLDDIPAEDHIALRSDRAPTAQVEQVRAQLDARMYARVGDARLA